MSKVFKGSDDESFRVLVELVTSDGEVVYGEQVFGPYPNRQVALTQARVQVEEQPAYGRDVRVFIQRTETRWECVERVEVAGDAA